MRTNTPYNTCARKLLCSSAWCCVALSARVVLAHPGPAEPPAFPAGPCVTVVDKSTQAQYELSYVVTIDDTAIDLTTDIPLPDAKSHQFFALAGSVIPNGQTFRFYPFDAAESAAVLLPDWITLSDVKRAAEASSQLTGTTFSADDFPHDMVLEDNPSFSGRWLRISADSARLPIRVIQSYVPVHWDLKDVPPGAYTIAGYVFSPPYNTWAPRAGVVKVRDATTDPPAGAISSIADSVFSYQGRRVQVCVDVPAGTQMTAYYHVEEQPALGWLPWIDTRSVETGDLELCFRANRQPFSGSVRLRIDLAAPGGQVTALHSRDTLTWLQADGTCEESKTKCCSFEGAHPQPTIPDADAASPVDAATSLETSMYEGAAPGTSAPAPRAHGCSAGSVTHTRTCPATLLALLLTRAMLRKRARRVRL